MIAKKQIPNLLTYARLAAVPLALLATCWPHDRAWILFLIFVFASITDFFDGYLARRWGVVSPIGTLLDPVADKLLVALMVIYLSLFMGLPLIIGAVIILREIYISALREFLATKRITLPVSKGGKLKTTLQMLGIAMMLAAPVVPSDSLLAYGTYVLGLAAFVTLLTAVQYTHASWKYLR